MTSKLSDYEKFVDSLKVEESETVENLDDINRKFWDINNKLEANKKALKYTTKVYVVKDLKFYISLIAPSRKESQIYWFKDMNTIYGEKLPKFKSKPLITLEGKSISLDIAELTKDYIKIGYNTESGYEEDKPDLDVFYFDMWIAEPN